MGDEGDIGNFIATAHCCSSTRRRLSDFVLAKKHAPTEHTLSRLICRFVCRVVCRVVCRCVCRLSADLFADVSADVSADSLCRSANVICLLLSEFLPLRNRMFITTKNRPSFRPRCSPKFSAELSAQDSAQLLANKAHAKNGHGTLCRSIASTLHVDA